MHVVFVTNKLLNGGGERVLAQLVAGVREAGGTSTILFLGNRGAIVPEIRSEIEDAGARVIMPNAPLALLSALANATALHLYNVNVYVKALPVLPFFRGARAICHVHGAAESANPPARRLFRAAWNPCDEIVFVSEANQTSWKITRGLVVSNPITFPPVRTGPLPAKLEAPRLISVNRLVAVKRVAAQLDILAALRHIHGLDATLDIVGDGPERAGLEAHAASLKLENALRFLGGRAHDEVLDLYREYDGFLATSAAEGLGLSLIEALAAGLPAFAAPIPAYREVGGVGGGVSFIEPGAPARAAADIAAALSSPPLPIADPAALTATFDAGHFVARMLELYK